MRGAFLVESTVIQIGEKDLFLSIFYRTLIHKTINYHKNLWTLPGSCGHSKPLYRKTYPVTALTAKNHRVSKNRGE